MKTPLVFLSVLLLRLSKSASEIQESPPKVTLNHGGVLVGSYMSTVFGKKFQAFLGIPYAEPPLGELRFKAPVPVKPWAGEKHADRDANRCLAQNTFVRKLENIGDEDCLYLNVYTPEIKEDKQLLPVMIYFHGGGFIVGSCNSEEYGPKRLLDHGIVYVCGNYRLGALGFLSTYTEDCPGNFGLKDQLLILKWVRENIEKFRGDPNNVTIFGNSAGGASVGHHIYAPHSKGLFHKAIMQSGTNFDPWTLGDKELVLETAIKVTLLLNCPVNETSWKESLDCLRTKTGYEVLSTYNDLLKYDFEPCVLFMPVVEPEHEGAFLTKDPRDVEIPSSAYIPIMIGMTTGEGILKSAPIIHNIKDDFEKKMYEVLPIFLYYESKPRNVRMNITKELDKFYFQGKHDWSPENHQNLTNLVGDGFFAHGQDEFLRYRFTAAENTMVGSTYYYLFDHRAPRSLSAIFGGGPHYYGVSHADELGYIFSSHVYLADGDIYDDKMKLAMLQMWTDFAKTGNPTPESSTIPKWIPTDKFPLNYAHIGRQDRKNWKILTNEVGLLEERMKFWRDLERLH